MKKVLMITYDFPPARTSGIYRPVKLIKYLDRSEWEPAVLTAKNAYVEAFDTTLLKDIPEGIRIYRALSIDLAKIRDRFYRLLSGGSKKIPSKEPDTSSGAGKSTAVKKAGFKSVIKKLFFTPVNNFIENWVFIPDSKIGWFPFALLKAISVVRKEKPDVIYSTSSPPTAQLVGMTLKTLFNKPWVVDLRDNWTLKNDLKLIKSDLRKKLDLWILGKIIKKADQIITMCYGNAEDLIEYYGDRKDGKYHTITNGFDLDDFSDIAPADNKNSGNTCRFLHMGTLYYEADGQFFPAIAELLEENSDMMKNMEFNFIGFLNHGSMQLIKDHNLDNYINLLGFKSHPEAVKAMFESDVLLMFVGSSRTLRRNYPGKFFEYLHCRKTILTLGKTGEIADALKKSNAGILVDHEDIGKIKDVIKNLCMKKLSGDLAVTPNSDFVNSFDYRNLSKRFAEVLEKAYNQHL